MSQHVTSRRRLGVNGPLVSPIGLGCMGMSEFYDPAQMDDAQSIRVIHHYLDSGGNFLDTADIYGVGRNEVLVGKAIAGRRDHVVLATKFGNVRGESGEFLGVRGDAQYVRDCCESSLRRLGVEVIDLYYQHRVDPATPIEETVAAMAELVARAKCGTSVYPRRRRRRSDARPRCTRSQRSRPSIHSGVASRKTRSCRQSARWVSRLSLIARSGADS